MRWWASTLIQKQPAHQNKSVGTLLEGYFRGRWGFATWQDTLWLRGAIVYLALWTNRDPNRMRASTCQLPSRMFPGSCNHTLVLNLWYRISAEAICKRSDDINGSRDLRYLCWFPLCVCDLRGANQSKISKQRFRILKATWQRGAWVVQLVKRNEVDFQKLIKLTCTQKTLLYQILKSF